jgi:EAL domain-containing protein (putative c-di-GMP-specific phosphodiesterase class I)
MFLDDLCVSKQSEAIVSASIYMAHQLNMTVVAEGVETAEQYEKLCAMKCEG